MSNDKIACAYDCCDHKDPLAFTLVLAVEGGRVDTQALKVASSIGLPLAYACRLEHLSLVMFATRHLAGRRTIVEGVLRLPEAAK